MVTRISGLASGMDIDSMVKSLMDAQRIPLDKLYQKKTYTEWQRDDYRTMNTALKEFDTLIADGIGRQSTFIQKTVSVSNPDVVSVKNINSTTDFSGSINNVTLAEAATMVSGSATGITDSTKTLSQLGIAAQKITIAAIGADGNSASKSIDIASTDTLDSVISKINANSGISVFFDSTSQKFSITAKNTGDFAGGAEITLSSDASSTDNFFNKLNLAADSDIAANATTPTGRKGTNASLDYDGLTITRSSNTFRINGAEITLKQNFNSPNPITFSSTADVDSIFKKVKEFVDSYNGLIANIQGKLSEKKDSSFPPLTDAQKKDMTADQVKLWEEKAKKGTLRNDSSLTSLLTNMRTSLYTTVSGASINSLSNLGIKTTKDYLSGGKLEIKDETKLREAIAANPNGIYELFMSDDGNDKSTAGDGLVRRLRGNLDRAMTDIGNKAGRTSSAVNNTFTLGRLLDEYNNKISAFEERMSSLETRYYKQFTAMEKAIQQANSQSSSLSSYFAN